VKQHSIPDGPSSNEGRARGVLVVVCLRDGMDIAAGVPSYVSIFSERSAAGNLPGRRGLGD
jgi:hypothetical protein